MGPVATAAAIVAGLAFLAGLTATVFGIGSFATGATLQGAGAFHGVEIEPRENPGFVAADGARAVVAASAKVFVAAVRFEKEWTRATKKRTD
jgi:hypothetical protein